MDHSVSLATRMMRLRLLRIELYHSRLDAQRKVYKKTIMGLLSIHADFLRSLYKTLAKILKIKIMNNWRQKIMHYRRIRRFTKCNRLSNNICCYCSGKPEGTAPVRKGRSFVCKIHKYWRMHHCLLLDCWTWATDCERRWGLFWTNCRQLACMNWWQRG